MLVNENSQVLLIDYGSATKIKDGEWLREIITTQIFASPQQLRGNAYSTTQNDMWSLGVVYFRMLHGFFPYNIQPKGGIHSYVNYFLFYSHASLIDPRLLYEFFWLEA